MTEPIRLLQMCCLSMSVLLLSLASCGGGSPVNVGDAAGDSRITDVWIPDVIQVDTSHLETASTVDTDGSGESDDVDATSSGDFMDPCDDNGDCKSGFCVAYMGEQVCTVECVEECPQGWECTQLQGGREPVWVCMSDFAHLCLPCSKSADCVFGGVGAVACVSYGPDGAFCGADCEVEADCPEGFSCLDATTTEGASTKQCMVPDGLCPCGSLAEDLGLGALCFVENQWGICTGTRACLDGVLTGCDASVPAKEVCNQADDDCDTFVDEEIDNCCMCGDGICHDFCESLETCSPDCAVCGDGVCSPGEDPCSCDADCCGTCGDGKCAHYQIGGQVCCTETPATCPDDCQNSVCGNSECEAGENPLGCPQDCELFFCGNGWCEPGEEAGGEKDCPQDCTEFCGNCVCEPDESFFACPLDCGFCGDGVCSPCASLHETLGTCFEDCCNPDCIGKECGSDGCGGSCGTCPAFPNYVCQDGVCQCTPDDCGFFGHECGDWPDGCGGTIACGGCPKQHVCNSGGVCECVPACPDWYCGPDGCYGTCQCASEETCWKEQCYPDPGLTWVSIPGGTFLMGCSPGDTDCYSNETPAHSVTLSPFQMLQTEVTEGQYETVMGTNPSCDYNGGGGSNSSVECVTWSQAAAFCAAVGARLPTEAEWEYAARGGTTTKYYCGDDSVCLDEIAWYWGNSDDGPGVHKHDVKGKVPNAFGLYDMPGNVWEWTGDWYDSGYYADSPANNPQGPDSGWWRVYRGGSFYGGGSFLRVSGRLVFDPLDSLFNVGGRCCRSE